MTESNLELPVASGGVSQGQSSIECASESACASASGKARKRADSRREVILGAQNANLNPSTKSNCPTGATAHSVTKCGRLCADSASAVPAAREAEQERHQNDQNNNNNNNEFSANNLDFSHHQQQHTGKLATPTRQEAASDFYHHHHHHQQQQQQHQQFLVPNLAWSYPNQVAHHQYNSNNINNNPNHHHHSASQIQQAQVYYHQVPNGFKFSLHQQEQPVHFIGPGQFANGGHFAHNQQLGQLSNVYTTPAHFVAGNQIQYQHASSTANRHEHNSSRDGEVTASGRCGNTNNGKSSRAGNGSSASLDCAQAHAQVRAQHEALDAREPLQSNQQSDSSNLSLLSSDLFHKPQRQRANCLQANNKRPLESNAAGAQQAALETQICGYCKQICVSDNAQATNCKLTDNSNGNDDDDEHSQSLPDETTPRLSSAIGCSGSGGGALQSAKIIFKQTNGGGGNGNENYDSQAAVALEEEDNCCEQQRSHSCCDCCNSCIYYAQYNLTTSEKVIQQTGGPFDSNGTTLSEPLESCTSTLTSAAPQQRQKQQQQLVVDSSCKHQKLGIRSGGGGGGNVDSCNHQPDRTTTSTTRRSIKLEQGDSLMLKISASGSDCNAKSSEEDKGEGKEEEQEQEGEEKLEDEEKEIVRDNESRQVNANVQGSAREEATVQAVEEESKSDSGESQEQEEEEEEEEEEEDDVTKETASATTNSISSHSHDQRLNQISINGTTFYHVNPAAIFQQQLLHPNLPPGGSQTFHPNQQNIVPGYYPSPNPITSSYQNQHTATTLFNYLPPLQPTATTSSFYYNALNHYPPFAALPPAAPYTYHYWPSTQQLAQIGPVTHPIAPLGPLAGQSRLAAAAYEWQHHHHHHHHQQQQQPMPFVHQQSAASHEMHAYPIYWNQQTVALPALVQPPAIEVRPLLLNEASTSNNNNNNNKINNNNNHNHHQLQQQQQQQQQQQPYVSDDTLIAPSVPQVDQAVTGISQLKLGYNLIPLLPINAIPTRIRQAYGMDKVWQDEFEQLFSQFVSQVVWTLVEVETNPNIRNSSKILDYRARYVVRVNGAPGNGSVCSSSTNDETLDDKEETDLIVPDRPEELNLSSHLNSSSGLSSDNEGEDDEEGTQTKIDETQRSPRLDVAADQLIASANVERWQDEVVIEDEDDEDDGNSSGNQNNNGLMNERGGSNCESDCDSGAVLNSSSASGSSSLTTTSRVDADARCQEDRLSSNSSDTDKSLASGLLTNNNLICESSTQGDQPKVSEKTSRQQRDDGPMKSACNTTTTTTATTTTTTTIATAAAAAAAAINHHGQSRPMLARQQLNGVRKFPLKFRMFIDSAKVRFCCESCGHGWTSMKGRVVFWYELFELVDSDDLASTSPLNSKFMSGSENQHHHHQGVSNLIGYCAYKLFGQQCDVCKVENRFERPMWYPEEVTKVLCNLYNKIGQVYFGFRMPAIDKQRRAGKPKTSHNSLLCQACHDGVCTDRK